MIHASKSGEGLAFLKALKLLGEVDPRTVLHIDDNETYSANARKFGHMRGFHFSSAEKLHQELSKAKLIP